ncbi:ABC thiamine transporter, inner membrane subunit [Oceaniovalibus guishaninsula JLT2003]|uniref:ABC thiamine transporter, inner membrane subunit n=1 Tax=Oceaniovalibus guishaninsula JLT2003 TaxID=1231392 RepID=K2HC58_9RHOB|nr:ABC transporter permease subunit [Oceaniovalibus guishaninsula]EKE44182.1 ABC thiamine transporter, inner membrane subunit [Oceaniovalibus guishaninsula JLT2003]
MAVRPRPLTVAGVAVAGIVFLLVAGTIAAVAVRADGGAGLRPSDLAAIRFTLWQAVLSAILSVGLAVPVARALARRRFAGRRLLVTLLGAPFILPVIVAVLGLLMVFGRGGWINAAGTGMGLPPVSIYGPWGVVLAHVFFNLPLAVRLILQGWLAVPSERFRLAASLGLGPWATFRLIELPILRGIVPGAALIVFLVCTTSFAVALALGGGPRATTIELAIYQAFRFDFDLGRAALLALVQLAVTVAAATLALTVALPDTLGGGLDRHVARWDLARRWPDGIRIGLAALFLLLPLAALILRGVPNLAGLDTSAWLAAMRSVVTAMGATVLTLCAALPVAVAMQRLRWGRVVEGLASLAIAASPLVVGTGLFILIFPLVDPALMALPVTALVNAAMALPFAIRAIGPQVAQTEARYGPLADSLGLTGAARLRLLILPRLCRPLGFAAGLTAALSMGDLGVVALFADGRSETLPLHLYRLMGAYRMDDAAGAAVLLLALSLGAFWALDRGGRVDAGA